LRATGAAARSLALTALLLAGCVVLPVERLTYDPECRTMRREVALEPAVLGSFQSCGGRECAALLAALGVVSAASVVISGSVAVVGNAVYWFEHRGRCLGQNSPTSTKE
jgi:hypothetical protein